MRKNVLWLVAGAAVVVGGIAIWQTRPPVAPGQTRSAALSTPPPSAQIASRPNSPDAAGADDAAVPGPFAFRRLIVNTGGQQPEACLRFSARLDPRIEVGYADYIAITPALQPAVRVAGTDLCLGGLAFGTDYTLTLRQGLPAAAVAGAEPLRLGKTIRLPVSLADRAPLVAISGDGYLLPRQTARGIAIETVNVDSVRVHVLRVNPTLLTQALSGPAREFRIDLTATQTESYELDQLLQNAATPIWSGTMAVPRDHNRTVETAFPLAGIVRPRVPGAYLVIAENAARALPETRFGPDASAGNDASATLASHWVIVTDLGVTTMSGRDGLHAFVRSFASALPLARVKLSLLSAAQEVLGTLTTDADGQAAFPAGLMAGRGANAPHQLVAEGADNDFTLLDLDRAAFDFSDRGVTGRAAAGKLDAFLATERGIYRPGETLNVVALLRDARGIGVDGAKLSLILRRPDGVEYRRQTADAAMAGGLHAAFTLTRTAARGAWSVEARVDPTGPPIGRTDFQVQDFVPLQLKVALSLPQTGAARILVPGVATAASLDGQFLYGAPAAGLNGEAELRTMRDPDPVPGLTGYAFGLVDETVKETSQTLTVPVADAAGHSAIAITPTAPDPGTAPLQATLRAGLFEPSGRIVNDSVTLKLRTQKLLIGLRSASGGTTGSTDGSTTAASFELRCFDPDGHPIARAGLHWSIVRENQVYDWFQAGNAWSFHYHTVDEPVRNGDIDSQADRPVTVGASLDWGSYRFVVTDAATGAASSLRQQVGWAENAGGDAAPDKVAVSAETPSLAPGQTTRIHVHGPFAGQAQVTIAGDRVFETHSLAVPAGGADVTVTASADWGPGAYALVSMYRPLNQPTRAHDPVRAVGLVWLALDTKPHALAVAIDAPAQVLPRQRLVVPVHITGAAAGKGGWVSLAAVDEGILQLTAYATPNPSGYLFGQRRLGIDMRDEYGRLLDDSVSVGAIRQGGDAAIGGEGLPVTSTKIVSLFAGPVAFDAGGNAQASLEVPDFEGRLRLMAVAWNHDAVGASEHATTVRDPTFADIALPRFLAPGDTAQSTVSVANTDGPAGAYHIVVKASGAVRLQGQAAMAITLAQGARKAFAVQLAGIDQGIGEVSADLSGPGHYRLHRAWQIAVRPGHYPITLTQTAQQMPGESFRVDPRQADSFLPGSLTVSVGYAGYAGIDTPGLLQALYRYPYGCTEQLVSAAAPLIYFNDPGLLGRIPRDAGAVGRVQQAVDTIIDREDPAGRFGLWQVGDGQASPWLDAYATEFLIHARDNGFAVPEPALNRALFWLATESEQSDDDYTGLFRPTADESRAYALYVLSQAGRGDLGLMRRMHDTASLASNAGGPRIIFWGQQVNDDGAATPLSLGHLAAALAASGDRARAHDGFRQAVDQLGEVRSGPPAWLDFTYWSYLRDVAGLTAIAAESGEADLAQSLIDRLRRLTISSPQLNTQEQAALLSAAHAMNRDAPGRAIALNGRAVAPLKLPAELAPDLAAIRAGYAVANTGSVPLWRTLTVSGVPASPPPALDAGFTIERSSFALDGKPVDPAHLRQNDRFIVVLHGEAQDTDNHRTVLVDMLPAGWEIEAPISDPAQYKFVGALTRTRVSEARDDRFVAAFDLGAGLSPEEADSVDDSDKSKPEPLDAEEYRLAYIVRVVTPGRFLRPEAEVEDMYRPQLMSRTESGLTVADPR